MTNAERQRKHYQARRESGLCVKCGKPAAESRHGKPLSQCNDCLDRHNGNRASKPRIGDPVRA